MQTTNTALANRLGETAVRRNLNASTSEIVFGVADLIERSLTVNGDPHRARSLALAYLAGRSKDALDAGSLSEFALALRTVEEALR